MLLIPLFGKAILTSAWRQLQWWRWYAPKWSSKQTKSACRKYWASRLIFLAAISAVSWWAALEIGHGLLLWQLPLHLLMSLMSQPWRQNNTIKINNLKKMSFTTLSIKYAFWKLGPAYLLLFKIKTKAMGQEARKLSPATYDAFNVGRFAIHKGEWLWPGNHGSSKHYGGWWLRLT